MRGSEGVPGLLPVQVRRLFGRTPFRGGTEEFKKVKVHESVDIQRSRKATCPF